MIRLLVSICILGLVSWTGTKKMAPAADSTVAEAISYNLDSTAMLNAVNAVRQKGCNCGGKKMPAVAPVTWNHQLAKAALDHSNDMHTNNFFAHETSKSTPGQRIRTAGYEWKAYGENLAYDNTDEKGVVQGWVESAPHCRTLMSPLYKEIGAARAGAYWTMDFGMR